jgi:hypothetical protein
MTGDYTVHPKRHHQSQCVELLVPKTAESVSPATRRRVLARRLLMSKVTVYRYATLDRKAATMRVAHRWATRKAIENLNKGVRVAAILADTETEIDASYLDRNEMTEVWFDPSAHI